MKEESQCRNVRLASEALGSDLWLLHFGFFEWLSVAITQILTFGGSCLCHQTESMRGDAVECDQKGRVLPICYQFGMDKLRGLLAAANGWTKDAWGGDLLLLSQLQGCMRSTLIDGQYRLKIYDQIPLLFGRLDEPGVRDRCRQQFESVAADKHLPPTLYTMMPDQPLRDDFENMNADGSGMSARLRKEVLLI